MMHESRLTIFPTPAMFAPVLILSLLTLLIATDEPDDSSPTS